MFLGMRHMFSPFCFLIRCRCLAGMTFVIWLKVIEPKIQFELRVRKNFMLRHGSDVGSNPDPKDRFAK